MEEILQFFVNELACSGDCLFGVVYAADDLLEDLVEKSHAIFLKNLDYFKDFLECDCSNLGLVVDEALEYGVYNNLLTFPGDSGVHLYAVEYRDHDLKSDDFSVDVQTLNIALPEHFDYFLHFLLRGSVCLNKDQFFEFSPA